MRIRVPIVAIVITLGLAACVAPVTVEPTPTGEPSTSAPPTSTTPARLIMTAEAVTIIDADGATLDEFTFFEPASDVVAVLTEIFGQPEVSAVEAAMDNGARTNYDWSGVLLIDEEGPVQPPYHPDFFLIVSTSELDGVDLVTADGSRVGDSGAELEARYPDWSRRVTIPGQEERLDVNLGFVDLPDVTEGEPLIGISIWAIASPSDGPITELRVPSPVLDFE